MFVLAVRGVKSRIVEGRKRATCGNQIARRGKGNALSKVDGWRLAEDVHVPATGEQPSSGDDDDHGGSVSTPHNTVGRLDKKADVESSVMVILSIRRGGRHTWSLLVMLKGLKYSYALQAHSSPATHEHHTGRSPPTLGPVDALPDDSAPGILRRTTSRDPTASG